MKIRKEISYILENEDAMTALAPSPGQSLRLELEDGKYHGGEVTEVSEKGITISSNDGDYTNALSVIQEYVNPVGVDEHQSGDLTMRM